ncbi:MAG: ABC transporter ATP-binding protein [Methanobacteriota archaeon]|nr:MAG: ABC transporter ATP-binding protein [Euryarchaeota archaeon]TLZ66813.1 MAG: ABC transporter ATP-binding protein [Euryarchaeota archaeon]
MPVLDIKNLILWYRTRKGPVHAVDDISFALEPGQTIALVGESGSGKTSTANAILRLLPKNVLRYEGKVVFDGQDVMEFDTEEFRKVVRWRGISMVFQGAMNSLNPTIRVGGQVAEPLMVHYDVDRDEAADQAIEALGKVGLSADTARRFPFELSGGMKQRVVIAMALILKPKVVILDEPTSALDVMTQTNIINLLKELKNTEHLSYIFITHDLGLASELADLVGIVYAGQLVEVGPAEGVFVKPKHPYTGKLLASVPRLRSEAAPDFIPGAPPDLTDPPPGCRFHLRCPVSFEKCGWSAPEFIEQVRLLQILEETKNTVPAIEAMTAKGAQNLLIKPVANGTVAEFAQRLTSFIAQNQETYRFLKSVESVQAKTKVVEVKLYESTPPPLLGGDWRASCWLLAGAGS